MRQLRFKILILEVSGVGFGGDGIRLIRRLLMNNSNIEVWKYSTIMAKVIASNFELKPIIQSPTVPDFIAII